MTLLNKIVAWLSAAPMPSELLRKRCEVALGRDVPPEEHVFDTIHDLCDEVVLLRAEVDYLKGYPHGKG